MRHKHADVFEAAAKGEAEEFEVRSIEWGYNEWQTSGNYLECLYLFPNDWQPRRKQKTHVVNGFTVPEPLRDALPRGAEYFIEEPACGDFFSRYEWDSDFDFRCMQRGIAHATREGAIANCKARLGIDPYKDES